MMRKVLGNTSGRISRLNLTVVNVFVRSYHENVVDHYENPRNVGSLDKNKKNVGTGKELSSHPFIILV